MLLVAFIVGLVIVIVYIAYDILDYFDMGADGS